MPLGKDLTKAGLEENYRGYPGADCQHRGYTRDLLQVCVLWHLEAESHREVCKAAVCQLGRESEWGFTMLTVILCEDPSGLKNYHPDSFQIHWLQQKRDENLVYFSRAFSKTSWGVELCSHGVSQHQLKLQKPRAFPCSPRRAQRLCWRVGKSLPCLLKNAVMSKSDTAGPPRESQGQQDLPQSELGTPPFSR